MDFDHPNFLKLLQAPAGAGRGFFQLGGVRGHGKTDTCRVTWPVGAKAACRTCPNHCPSLGSLIPPLSRPTSAHSEPTAEKALEPGHAPGCGSLRRESAGRGRQLDALFPSSPEPFQLLLLCSCRGRRTEEKHHFPLQTKTNTLRAAIQHESVECGDDVWWESAPAAGRRSPNGDSSSLSSTPLRSRGQKELLDSSARPHGRTQPSAPRSPCTSPSGR